MVVLFWQTESCSKKRISVFVKLCLRLAMLLHGDTYIAQHNILPFLTAPTTILILLLLCTLITLLHVVGIAGVMHAYSVSMIGRKANFSGMLAEGLRVGMWSFSPKNWTLFPFVMVLLPLTGFFTLSFSSVQAVIPGFIKAYITADTLYLILYRILYAALLLMELVYIFSMNHYLLQGGSFTASCRKSRALIRGRYLQTILCLAITAAALLFCATTAFSGIVSAVFVRIMNWFPTSSVETNASRLTTVTMQFNSYLGALLAPGVNIAALTQLFFQYTEDRNELASMSRHAFHNREWKKWQRIAGAAVLILLLGVYIAQNYVYWRESFWTPEFPMIAAHRGDSVNAPENSRPAFQLAVYEDVDWVELDVHQTKDGVIIVSHDDNLSRISGKNVFVHDLTYDEIKAMDVGSWFSPDYADLRITTLDEALKLLKDIYVQIEIKPNGMDEGIEECVLAIINANGMHDRTAILCLQPEPLRRVKELDPTMRTIYCMSVAWGDVTDFPYANEFSIEEQSITRELVSNIHANGGVVYCWTINSESSAQYLLNCRVDCIVTDNPLLMRRAFQETWHAGGIAGLLRYYLNTMRNVRGL